MKNKYLQILACVVIGLIIFNTSLTSNEYDITLEDIGLMAMAQTELPGGTITCSYGSEGRCFRDGDPDYSIGIFGLPMCETTCDFSGYQSDYCVAGAPC